MNKKTQLVVSCLVVIVSMLACNLPIGEPAVTPSPTATVQLFVETPTLLPPTATQCAPTITTNRDSNVRKGPSQVYDRLGFLPQGSSATVAGKNAEGTWWYIQFVGGENGHGWVSGSIVTANCIPNDLAVIAAPPVPVAQSKPSKTPKPSNNNDDNDDDHPTATPTQDQSGNTGEVIFKLEFHSVWNCGGQPRISAKLYNIGTATIESVMYSVEANGLYINGGTINSSPFEGSATEPEPDCAQDVGHGQSSLAPGGNAFIPIIVSSVPAAGTEGFLYVEACSENNRKGTCVGQFVYFKF